MKSRNRDAVESRRGVRAKGSESIDDGDRYAAPERDRYEVSSESSDDSESRDTYDSDETSSFASSYDTRDYDSLDSMYIVDDIDVDIDEFSSSAAAEEYFIQRRAAPKRSFLGGLVNSACGWPTISCFGTGEASLLRESKFNNAPAARQRKLNDTISKSPILRKKFPADDRPSVRLERTGPIDTDEFSVAFKPQEQGLVCQGQHMRRQKYKTIVKPATIAEVFPIPNEGLTSPNQSTTSENKESENAPPSGNTEIKSENRNEAEIETRSGGETRESNADSALPPRIPEKEPKTLKNERISAWKRRIQAQQDEETNNLLPIQYPTKKDDEDGERVTVGTEEEDKPEIHLHRSAVVSGDKAENAVGSLGLPESEEIESETKKPQKQSTIQSVVGEEGFSPKYSSANSITDLTHIEDDQIDILGELSLPDLPPIPTKVTKVHRRKKKKSKAGVEVVQVLQVDQNALAPSEVRDPSPSKASHRSKADTSRDPTPSRSEHSQRRVRDPSGLKNRQPSPLKTHASMQESVEDLASSMWEEEAKKLSQQGALDFSSAWHTREAVVETKSSDFQQTRINQLERPKSTGGSNLERPTSVGRSRSKSRDRIQPEVFAESNHSRGSRKSQSNHSRYESPIEGRYDTRPTALEYRQRAMESSSAWQDSNHQDDAWENLSVATPSTPSKIRDFVQIRSIDEAQSLRQSRGRPTEEPASRRSHRSKSRESREQIIDTGVGGGKSPQPIDVHKYMAESIRSGDRTFAHSREIAENALRKSRSQDPTAGHNERSPIPIPRASMQASIVPEDQVYSANPENFSEAVISTVKSRDSRHSAETSSMLLVKSRSRDVTPEVPLEVLDEYQLVRKSRSRESSKKNRSTRSTRSRRSEIGDQGDYPQDLDEISRNSTKNRRSDKGDQDDDKSIRRRERRLREKEEAITASNELKKLEKRIEKQLLQVRKDQKENGSEWDDQSAVSAKDLRRLEKQLVQRLQKEDEKRAAKLKRIRKRKEASNRNREEPKTVSENIRPAETVRRKAADPRERSKYDQLRVLRTSRPAMRRYLAGSRVSDPTPHQEEILG